MHSKVIAALFSSLTISILSKAGWLVDAPPTQTAPVTAGGAITLSLPTPVANLPQSEPQGGMGILSSGEAPDEITPEIQALTRSIVEAPGDYPAWADCFNFVSRGIEYEHYYGSKKGAHLTLLERSGNDADMATLLVAMLRSAGYPARYAHGNLAFLNDTTSSTRLQNWLGVPPAQVAEFCLTRGYPSVTAYTSQSGAAVLAFKRVWVQVQINGTWYSLDPAFKFRLRTNPAFDALQISGYTRPACQAAGGGTVTATSIEGISETNLAQYLQARVTALLGHIDLNHHASDALALCGTWNHSPPTSSDGLPYTFIGTQPTGDSAVLSDTLPASLLTSLSITLKSTASGSPTIASYTCPASHLKGRRLSIAFTTATSTGKAQVFLDDEIIAQETVSAVGTAITAIVGIDHPHNNAFGATLHDQSVSNTYKRGSSYTLAYAFSDPIELLRKRQEQLDVYKRAGEADDSRKVRTETLNVIGLTWLHQTWLATRMACGMKNCDPTYMHRMGTVSQESGYFVDVNLSYDGLYDMAAPLSTSTVRGPMLLALSTLHSAMEHAALEQLQGAENPAVSTVKLIRLANQQTTSRKLFLATPATWNGAGGVRSQLTGYDTADFTKLDAAMSTTNGKALVPQKGNLSATGWNWTGAGYITLADTAGTWTLGMMISGGLNGGYATRNNSYVNPPRVSNLSNSNPFRVNTTPWLTLAPKGLDPIDLASGDYEYSSTDLDLGLAVPRGLVFSRQYHAGRRWTNPASLGFGWTHNWQVKSTRRSAYEPVFGIGGTPYDPAAAMLALAVMLDLYGDTPSARNWSLAALTAHWLTDQIQDNAVAISIGERSLQFVRRCDGAWQPPGGVTMTLTPATAPDTWLLKERHGNTWRFDASGRLAAITDLWNKTLSVAYVADKVSTVTDAYARTLTFTYTAENLTRVTDSTGRFVEFTFDAARDQKTSADAESKLRRFTYDAEHRITEIRNHDNEVIAINHHDAAGKVVEQLSQGLVSRTWKYYYAPKFSTETDPYGNKVCYLFDSRRRQEARMDETGRITATLHDGQNRQTHVITGLDWISFNTNPSSGFVKQTIYDRFHNPTQIVDEAQKVTQFRFDGQNRLDKVTDPLGHVITEITQFNAAHQPLFVKNHLGETTSLEYDSATGELKKSTDPAGNATQFFYNTVGLREQTVHPGPQGHYEFVTYTNRGDPQTVRDARGNTTTHTYNLRRQPLLSTSPGLPSVQREYDNQGRLWKVTDARGHCTTHLYSATDKPITTTLPDGATVTETHYLNDRRETVTLPKLPGEAALTTRFTYYDNGLIHKTIDPLQHEATLEYNSRNLLEKSSDSLGHATTTQFNSRGLPETVTDPLLNTSTSGYDDAGRRTTQVNRLGHTYIFGYDDANRLRTTTTPEGREYGQTYHSTGLPHLLTEPSGQTTTLLYDSRGRVETRTDGDGAITYQYDPNGNLEHVVQNGVDISRTWDANNRISTYNDGRGHTLGYQFDPNGNLTHLTYEPGKTVEYEYDSRNRLVKVTDWHNRVTQFAYDGPGRLTSITRPNGTVRTHTWDAAGRLTAVMDRHVASGLPVAALRTTYDAADRLTGKLELPLWPDHRPLAPLAAEYNDDNQFTLVNQVAVQHDTDGNITSGPSPKRLTATAAFTWNTRNQLTSGPDGVTCAYDAEGHRVSLTEPGVGTTHFVNDPNTGLSRVLWRVKPDGSRTFYVHGGSLLYEIEETGNSVRYYHYDQLGSTIALSDATGRLTARAAYSAYGVLLRSSGHLNTPFLWNGAVGVQTDPNGLHYMRARYYHARLGRFLSEDPLGLSAGPNVYAYCAGNPIMLNDPSGLWFGIDDLLFSVVGGIIGGAGKFIANLVTGSEHHWQDYVGAATGGAAGGLTLLYTGNPFAAGAAGGATGSLVNQGLNFITGRQTEFSLRSLAIDTAVGTATGFIPGRPRISGVNAGRGSDLQVFRQVVTKARNGTISNISNQTAVRMTRGAYYQFAVPQGAAVSSFASQVYSNFAADASNLPVDDRRQTSDRK